MDEVLEETLALNKTTLEVLRDCILDENLDRVRAHNLFSQLESLHYRIKSVAVKGVV